MSLWQTSAEAVDCVRHRQGISCKTWNLEILLYKRKNTRSYNRKENAANMYMQDVLFIVLHIVLQFYLTSHFTKIGTHCVHVVSL
jgi:hypothetical protein